MTFPFLAAALLTRAQEDRPIPPTGLSAGSNTVDTAHPDPLALVDEIFLATHLGWFPDSLSLHGERLLLEQIAITHSVRLEAFMHHQPMAASSAMRSSAARTVVGSPSENGHISSEGYSLGTVEI
jgi:hypothetical protein